MKTDIAVKLIPLALAVAGGAALWAWTGHEPTVPADGAASPGQPGQVESGSTGAGVPRGRLTRGDGMPSAIAAAWPQFRGPNRDGISPESVPLAPRWPAEGPRQLWSLELGEGHAGAAVLNGRVYLLDYDRQRQCDALRCLSLDDGREIWRYAYPMPVKRNHGMSRTVPAVTDRYVVALGPKCHVICLDSATGELLWSIDLVRQYGAKVPPWYAGQCPLIDGDKAILAPAGPNVLAMAVDCATGKVVWTTPNARQWHMTHSSLVPMELGGLKMYVYCGSGGVAGISAKDGSLLWDTADWKIAIATIPSPAPIEGGRIFLSGGYEAGCMMLQLQEQDGKISARSLWRLKSDLFGATQQTPILYQGRLYGVRPDGELVCLDASGHILWTSGAANRFGIGAFLLADGKLLVMNDSGVLTMVEATPAAYRQLAQAKVLPGHDSWGPMAMVSGRLLARDLTRLVCLDLSQ